MPRLESRARARALQALYAWDLREGQPLDRVAALVWDDLAVEPAEREFAMGLLRVFIAQGADIDADLAAVTTNWRLERLGAIERCVLRLAASEMVQGGTPAKVVIQEAVRMAERFGTEQSARFCNGVLDALARKMGQL